MFPLDPVLRKIVVKGALPMVDAKGVAHSYRGRRPGPVRHHYDLSGDLHRLFLDSDSISPA